MRNIGSPKKLRGRLTRMVSRHVYYVYIDATFGGPMRYTAGATDPAGQTLGQTASFRQTAPETGVSPGFAGQRPLHCGLDLDLPRFGGLLLDERDGEHAIVIGGADFVGVEGAGHGKTADEIAIAALDAMIALFVAGSFEFAFA